MTKSSTKKHHFGAEVNELLKLVIHSLYSDKEIFLRELISNASDACDKLRFEAISKENLYEDDTNLNITILFDKDKKNITISDNGIGMDQQEVIDNIGTIARSGTRAWIEKMSQSKSQKDANQIGQFGVGFYAAFIVAESVTLETRKAGQTQTEGTRWYSNGDGSYNIEKIKKEQKGTTITLQLREGEEELLNHWKISSLIRKYSNHINFPIQMQTEKKEEEESDEEKNKKTDKKKDKPETVELEKINNASALWQQSRKDITDEEYKEFYKQTCQDYQDPQDWLHARVEGTLEYSLLFYIPSKPNFDLYDPKRKHGIKLYVQRVFILEDTEKLLPNYLRFIRGIIDSDDLPLNVSREMIQSSATVKKIAKGATKKALSLLDSIAKNKAEEYDKFWQSFGAVLKEGVVEDQDNKEKIAELCRFSSTYSKVEKQTVSLTDYISRMPPGQEKIYYLATNSYLSAYNSPHLEVFNKKNIEVLLLSDKIDQWVTSHLREFGKDKIQLQSITKGELSIDNIGEKDKKENKNKKKPAEIPEKSKKFMEQVKSELDDKIEEVRVSERLVNSAACIVIPENSMDSQMEQLMRSMGQEIPKSKRILEINLKHPLIQRMSKEKNKNNFKEWALVLYDQALISEGIIPEEPTSYTKRVNTLFEQFFEKE